MQMSKQSMSKIVAGDEGEDLSTFLEERVLHYDTTDILRRPVRTTRQRLQQ